MNLRYIILIVMIFSVLVFTSCANDMHDYNKESKDTIKTNDVSVDESNKYVQFMKYVMAVLMNIKFQF